MAKITTYSNDTDITNNDRLFGTSVDGAANETANFKVGELKTFILNNIATEAYADQAETDANAYTDAREVAITSAYQAYADQAETDANAYALAGDAAVTTALKAYADQAEADANIYTDNAISAAQKQKIAAQSVQLQVDGVGVAINTDHDITYLGVNNNALNGSLNINPATPTPNLTIDASSGIISNTGTGSLNIKISMSAFTVMPSGQTTVTYKLFEATSITDPFTLAKAVQRNKSEAGDHVDSFYTYYQIPSGHAIKFTFSSDSATTILANSWFEITEI